jgi:hypothetical protein
MLYLVAPGGVGRVALYGTIGRGGRPICYFRTIAAQSFVATVPDWTIGGRAKSGCKAREPSC